MTLEKSQEEAAKAQAGCRHGRARGARDGGAAGGAEDRAGGIKSNAAPTAGKPDRSTQNGSRSTRRRCWIM